METFKTTQVGKVHFHTFDSYRFFSFLLVFLHHCPVPKTSFLNFFSHAGGIGVSFFFVLSGFLITYYLLAEKLGTGTVNLPDFFRRRILRIWPLYYAMALFAFCTPFILRTLNLAFSSEGYEPNWLVTWLFLENYKILFSGSFPNVSPLRVMWSLCIEEHFYIFWGLAFYIIPLKRIPKFLTLLIFSAPLVRVVYKIYNIDTLDLPSNVDYFAFGAIPSYIFVQKKQWLARLENFGVIYKYAIAIITIATIFVLSNLKIDTPLTPTFLAIIFTLLILITLGKKNAFRISDRSIWARMGKYTYGLYLFHTIFINLIIKLGERFQLSYISIMIGSFVCTLIAAMLSYHLFEKFFLRLKYKRAAA